jgi:purine-nucleoside/S-methyl-5'-thioadenosine phosphorylase / adenosine deaminase
VTPPFERRDDGDLAWLECRLGDARAAFSTRRGGVSEGPYESLNLGILTDDERERVARNREILTGALGRDPAAVAMGWQVHGAEVQVHHQPPSAGRQGFGSPGDDLERVDAQVTDSPEVTPLVLVADCVPVALAAPGAVAMVHCGWRGVAGGVVDRAATALRRLAGDGVLRAALGPAIGQCCYEVGPEVADVFVRNGHADALDGRMLDLPHVVCCELEALGVSDIARADMCVSCHPELFFSHRRDGGVTGRQAGLAWLAS